MQVRSTARPVTVARRPVVAAAQPTMKAAVQPAAPAKAAPPIKVKTDAGFGSDMLQNTIFSLTNLGQIVNLGALSGLMKALPKNMLGIANIAYGAFGLFKDVKGLKAENNTRNGDNYTRIAGGVAVVAGGAALAAGAMVAPWLPLMGAGVAAAGFLAKAVGTWNAETRF